MYDVDGKGSYRQRSAGNVLAEVDDRHERLGMQHFLFDDDTFTIVGREEVGSRGYDRVTGIADGMQTRDLEWSFMTRVDCHSLKLFEYMRERGAVGLKVGIESFSDKTLEGVTKNMTAAKQIETVEALVAMGYSVYLATMTYIPGESEDDRKRTTEVLDRFLEIGVKWQRPHCTPIPGTPLFEIFKAEGYDLESDFSIYDGGAGRMHKMVEEFNKEHEVEGFTSGRHKVEEPGHFQGHL